MSAQYVGKIGYSIEVDARKIEGAQRRLVGGDRSERQAGIGDGSNDVRVPAVKGQTEGLQRPLFKKAFQMLMIHAEETPPLDNDTFGDEDMDVFEVVQITPGVIQDGVHIEQFLLLKRIRLNHCAVNRDGLGQFAPALVILPILLLARLGAVLCGSALGTLRQDAPVLLLFLVAHQTARDCHDLMSMTIIIEASGRSSTRSSCCCCNSTTKTSLSSSPLSYRREKSGHTAAF